MIQVVIVLNVVVIIRIEICICVHIDVLHLRSQSRMPAGFQNEGGDTWGNGEILFPIKNFTKKVTWKLQLALEFYCANFGE